MYAYTLTQKRANSEQNSSYNSLETNESHEITCLISMVGSPSGSAGG